MPPVLSDEPEKEQPGDDDPEILAAEKEEENRKNKSASDHLGVEDKMVEDAKKTEVDPDGGATTVVQIEDVKTMGEEEMAEDSYIHLRPNMHTAMVVLPLVNAGSGAWEKVFLFVQVTYLYFFNILIQAFFTYFVYVMYKDAKDENGACGGYKNQGVLIILCIAVYVAYIVEDLAATWDIYLWVKCQSTVDIFTTLKYDIIKTKVLFRGKQDRTENARQKQHSEVLNEIEDEAMIFRSGITPGYKTAVYVCVIFPKAVLGLALLYFGTGYVTASESDIDVLLNALALVFIVEVAQLFYDFLVPGPFKEVIEELPPVRRQSFAKQATGMLSRCSCLGKIDLTEHMMLLKLIFLASITFAMLMKYCPDEKYG